MRLLALKFHPEEIRPGIWRLYGVYNQKRDDWDSLERIEREKGLAVRPEPPPDDVANLLWLRNALRELGEYYGKDPAFLIERFRREEETADSRRFLASHPHTTFHPTYMFDMGARVTVGEVGSAEIIRPPFGDADLLLAAMVAPIHYPFFATALLGGTHLVSRETATALEAATGPADFEQRLFSLFPSILFFDAQEDAMTLLTVDKSLMNETKKVLA